MPIKFRPKKELKLKEIIIRRITDPGNPYTKPKPVIELNKAFSGVSQRMFAIYSLRRSTGAIVGARGTRLDRRINRAAKDRLEHELLSEEAVNRLKDIKRRSLESKLQKKLQTTVGQDLKNVGKGAIETVINTPQTVKDTAKNVASGAKSFYENTGGVIGDLAKTTINHPEIVTGQAIVSPTCRVVAHSIFGPAIDAAYQSCPVGGGGLFGAIGEAARKARGHKVITITLPNGETREVTRRVATARKANAAKRAVIGNGWSIKGGVNKVRGSAKSLLTPINPNYNPSYQLKRATI